MKNCAAEPCTALQLLGHPKEKRKKLRDHRRCSSGTRDAACAAQPAKTTPNSEPAGTTVATGSPNSTNGQRAAQKWRRGLRYKVPGDEQILPFLRCNRKYEVESPFHALFCVTTEKLKHISCPCRCIVTVLRAYLRKLNNLPAIG